MALRASLQGVKDLVPDLDVDDSVIINNFMVTANVYVDDHLASADLSSSMLTEIEKYLAAHFATLSVEQGGLTRETIGASSSSYADIYDAGLGSTRFGVTAMALDTTGTLSRVGKAKIKAEFRIV